MCGLRGYSSMIKVIFSINLGHKMVQISWKSEDLEMKMFAVVWGQFPDGFFLYNKLLQLKPKVTKKYVGYIKHLHGTFQVSFRPEIFVKYFLSVFSCDWFFWENFRKYFTHNWPAKLTIMFTYQNFVISVWFGQNLKSPIGRSLIHD